MDDLSADSVALARPKRYGIARERKALASSRVSNGADVLPGVRDGRGVIARRYRDIQNAIVRDQSPGGAEHLPEARLQLIRRFAAAAVLAEQMESRVANGEQIDIAEHALLASTLVRIARQIGVNRIAKDITGLSLGEVLRQGIDHDRGA
jgi:hypothetical protein